MKKNIIILIIIICVIGIIFGCFLYKKEKYIENYTKIDLSVYDYLVNNNFISQNGMPLSVSQQKYKEFRDFIKTKKLAILKSSKKTPDTPEEIEKKRKDREEKKKKDAEERKKKEEQDKWKSKKAAMTSDLVDILKGAGQDTIKLAYGKIFNGDDIEWKHIAGTLAGTIGIGLLKIGLGACGLGFLRGPLDSLLFGGDDGPPPVPPIDYEKIRGIVTDSIFLGKLDTMVDSFNNCTEYLDSTFSLQKIVYKITCDPLNSEEENIKCVSEKNYDPNIIKPANISATEKNKRHIMSSILTSTNCPMYDLLIKSPTFVFHETYMFSYSMKITEQLFPSYMNLIMLEISYYQEKSLYDENLTNDENQYRNPWNSVYIGTISKIHFPQTSGTLLGQLQKRCITLFSFIKMLNKKYCSNLGYDWPCTACCTRACLGPQYKTCYFNDNNEMVDSDTGHWIGAKNQSMGGTDSPHWEPSRWGPGGGGIWGKNPVYYTMDNLRAYFFQPYEKLKDLKKMAGIEWLENEKWYDSIDKNNNDCPGWYADAIGSTIPDASKNNISYTTDGGYPFGLDKYSYDNAIRLSINDVSSDNLDAIYRTGSLCSPIIYGEKECIKCGQVETCINRISKDIVNNLPGNKEILKDDIYCINGGLQSCLNINKSPGNLDGSTTINRSLFCINQNKIISNIKTEKENLSCDFDPNDRYCGTSQNDGGTPIPKLPAFSPNSQEFNIIMTFSFSDNRFTGTASAIGIPDSSANSIEVPSCTYMGKKTYNITMLMTKLFNKLKLKNGYPYYSQIILDAPILNIVPIDQGKVNNTTRPPINTECKILGYEYITTIRAQWINFLRIEFKLRGIKNI